MLRNNRLLERDFSTVRRMRYMMGTFVEVEATGRNKAHATEAVEAAFSEMRRIEQLLSKFLPESPISQVNRFASSVAVRVPTEVIDLCEDAVRFSSMTNGAFDITVNALIELWGSAAARKTMPSDDEIEEALSRVGSAHLGLSREENSVFVRTPGVQLDFGGLGKGYAVDQAVETLRRYGVTQVLVNAGGNMYCGDAEKYSQIGIKNPLETDEIIASVALKDGAIATSANYERFFDISGERYGHLIDPRTGYPVRNEVLSVSIVSKSAQLADLFSTAVFVLGFEQGMQLVEQTNEVEAIMITSGQSDLKMHISSGLFTYIMSSS